MNGPALAARGIAGGRRPSRLAQEGEHLRMTVRVSHSRLPLVSVTFQINVVLPAPHSQQDLAQHRDMMPVLRIDRNHGGRAERDLITGALRWTRFALFTLRSLRLSVTGDVEAV